METISQRQLRNESSRILREVAKGATFRITNRGVPVADLVPLRHSVLDDLTLREGSGETTFPPGIEIEESTEEVLADLRADQ